MNIPYSKPSTLSDPYIDWQGCEGEIAKVIATKPEDLDATAYRMIYHQNLPAADYEEGCFYVPYFLDFYARGHDFESPNLEGFFWFIHHFRSNFERDGLLKDILERIWSVFLARTQSFSIHRLSDEELARYKICESYREIAPGSQTVHELLDCFTSWELYDPILLKLKEHFSDTSLDVKSFWFFECAFHTRTWLWVNSDPVDRRQDLFDFFHRLERFAAHASNILFGPDINKGFFQYNRRLSGGIT